MSESESEHRGIIITLHEASEDDLGGLPVLPDGAEGVMVMSVNGLTAEQAVTILSIAKGVAEQRVHEEAARLN